MRTAIRSLVLLSLLAATALLFCAALALQTMPHVTPGAPVSHEDVARVMRLVQQHGPGRAGGMRSVRLSARDLELLANHAAHRVVRARVAVRLAAGAAQLDASAPLPAGLWLNLHAGWVEAEGHARLHSLAIGALPLPAGLGERLLQAWLQQRGLADELALARDMVAGLRLQPDGLVLSYRWQGGAPHRALASLVPREEMPRLEAHVGALAALAGRHAPDVPLPLSQALAPLAALAAQRSRGDDDAAREWRAAVIVLTAYANGRSLAQWLPAARAWPEPPRRRITLDGREDFALHFLVSALLAIDGTSPLAHAVGVYKEVSDARGASGFSFDDIAADRAGTRLGELTLERPLELLRRIAAGADDAALMPRWRDLPQSLPEAEFLRRFGGVGAPEYTRLIDEIDRRVAALALLR